MYTLSTVLITLAVVALLWGLVNLIRPTGQLGMRERWHGGALVVAAFVIFVGGSLMAAAWTPDRNARPEAAPVADKSSDEAFAQVPESSAPTTPAVRTASMPEAEFDGFWNEVHSRLKRCSGEVMMAQAAMGTGDLQQARQSVFQAQATCDAVRREIDDLEVPASATGAVGEHLMSARINCSALAIAYSDFMVKSAVVINGDTRPETVQAARARGQSAVGHDLRCVADFARAATEAGLQLPIMRNPAVE